jgi:hypothetical protein
MIDTLDLSQRELDLITRAGAHILAGGDTPGTVQFDAHVTELDSVRLIHQIERGALVVPAGRAWHMIGSQRHPHLTRIVNECLRLGLVEASTSYTGPDIVRTALTAAPVHLLAAPGRPACPASDPNTRYRVLEDPRLLDCPACLARTNA